MSVRHFLTVSTIAAFSTLGCAAASDEVAESSDAALTTLAPGQCASPTTSEGPLMDASGNPIAGTGKTTLEGCIVGHDGESGAAVVSRLGALLSDTAQFATVENEPGHRLFSRFTAGQATGSLATGLVQDVDITLNEQYSPSTRLRFTRKKTADGGVSITIVNTTALVAQVLFGVTVVNPNDLKVSLAFKPEANGVTASGSSQITMQQGQEHAAEASGLVTSLFGWVSGQIAH